jgi:hypothetical protein
MSFRSRNDIWHARIFTADPAQENARSPWYALVRVAGWIILRSDGTVHQLPTVPGRNPIGWPFLELYRGIRRLLSPLAFPYFLLLQKCGQA